MNPYLAFTRDQRRDAFYAFVIAFNASPLSVASRTQAREELPQIVASLAPGA